MSFVNCELPAPQSSCASDEFQCDRLACVKQSRLCDYTDDCGDNSDEEGKKLLVADKKRERVAGITKKVLTVPPRFRS